MAKTKKRIYLNSAERQKVKEEYGETECTFAKDKDGYYCHTHRARSKSYPALDKIPKKVVKFIDSTS